MPKHIDVFSPTQPDPSPEPWLSAGPSTTPPRASATPVPGVGGVAVSSARRRRWTVPAAPTRASTGRNWDPSRGRRGDFVPWLKWLKRQLLRKLSRYLMISNIYMISIYYVFQTQSVSSCYIYS